jgi:small subunit ribosomal protein S21
MAQINLKPGEPLEAALKRFKKVLQQDGVLKAARAHEFYEKPSDQRRKASRTTSLSSLSAHSVPASSLRVTRIAYEDALASAF